MSTRRKLNIELLKRLRTRFLRMRHHKHFRMNDVAIKTDCGAAMCMVGHILTLEGYRMRLRKTPDYFTFSDAARSDYDFIHPETGKKINDPALEAASLLGAPCPDNCALFLEFNLRTPKQAARRLQKIIDNPSALR